MTMRCVCVRYSMLVTKAALVVALSACARDEGYNGRSADELARMLASADSNDRTWAADAFTHSPPSSAANVRALLVAANDTVPSVRGRARQALGQLRSNAVSPLVKALNDSDVTVRRRAAEWLGNTPDVSAKAVRPLVERFSDPDDSVRTLAILTLGAIGPLAYEARDAVRWLAQKRGPQRAAALAALPRVDTEAHTFISLYTDAFADTSPAVRAAVARNVLAAARDPHHDVLALLGLALEDPSDSVKVAALDVLRLLGADGSTLLSKVEALSMTGSPKVRAIADSAVRALRRSP